MGECSASSERAWLFIADDCVTGHVHGRIRVPLLNTYLLCFVLAQQPARSLEQYRKVDKLCFSLSIKFVNGSQEAIFQKTNPISCRLCIYQKYHSMHEVTTCSPLLLQYRDLVMSDRKHSRNARATSNEVTPSASSMPVKVTWGDARALEPNTCGVYMLYGHEAGTHPLSPRRLSNFSVLDARLDDVFQ